MSECGEMGSEFPTGKKILAVEQWRERVGTDRTGLAETSAVPRLGQALSARWLDLGVLQGATKAQGPSKTSVSALRNQSQHHIKGNMEICKLRIL